MPDVFDAIELERWTKERLVANRFIVRGASAGGAAEAWEVSPGNHWTSSLVYWARKRRSFVYLIQRFRSEVHPFNAYVKVRNGTQESITTIQATGGKYIFCFGGGDDTGSRMFKV